MVKEIKPNFVKSELENLDTSKVSEKLPYSNIQDSGRSRKRWSSNCVVYHEKEPAVWVQDGRRHVKSFRQSLVLLSRFVKNNNSFCSFQKFKIPAEKIVKLQIALFCTRGELLTPTTRKGVKSIVIEKCEFEGQDMSITLAWWLNFGLPGFQQME